MKTPRALGAAWLPLSPLEVSLPQLWEGMVPFVFPWEGVWIQHLQVP